MCSSVVQKMLTGAVELRKKFVLVVVGVLFGLLRLGLLLLLLLFVVKFARRCTTSSNE